MRSEKQTRGAEPNEDLFAEAMGDVEPLSGPRPVTRRPRRLAERLEEKAPPRFLVERTGAHHRGRAEGRRPRLVARLRGGAYPVERRIDLHGLTAEQARAHVESECAEAHRSGERCLLVIHGRGRGSVAGPVLREALPDWIAEPPLAHRVVAFVTAPETLGGVGATLVLLRPR